MSLDVSLYGEEETTECTCADCGNEHTKKAIPCYYSANITHNLGEMALKAGIYKHLWRPDEIGITKAKELIEPLKKGLDDLIARPEYFKKFNASNGWGKYDHLISFVREYLEACEQFPDADIGISR